MKERVVFVQVAGSTSSLYALDTNGFVWECFHGKWSKLDSPKETEKQKQPKKLSRGPRK